MDEFFLLDHSVLSRNKQVQLFLEAWCQRITMDFFTHIPKNRHSEIDWMQLPLCTTVLNLGALISQTLFLFPFSQEKQNDFKSSLKDCSFWSDLRDILEEIALAWQLDTSDRIDRWVEYPNALFLAKFQWSAKKTKVDVRKRFSELARTWELQSESKEEFLFSSEIKRDLHKKGFSILKNFYDKKTLQLAEQSLQTLIKAERWTEYSYHYLSGPRYSIGLTTRFGWTKIYNSIAHRIISAYPKLMSLALITRMDEKAGVAFYSGWHRPEKWENLLN